jgi:outer membrane lipoprotein-sorting protein
MRKLQSFRLVLAAVTALALSYGARAQSLESVLTDMDKAKDNFRTTEANFDWEQYTSVVQDTDVQKGKVYYRRGSHEIKMAVDITDPYPRSVLLSGGKLQVFEPRVNRVKVYDVKKNQGEFETFLVLGFGGGGHDLQNSFALKYLGMEKVEGVEAAKLDLVPKNPKILGMFPHITLWIDPARGISVQQQLFEQDGDYRMAKYSDIQLNRKLPDSVFTLKTNGKTVIDSVSP